MGIQHPPMAMCAGEQHSWEHLPDNLSQSNSSHCQSAMSSERGKITSPGKFLSGHFMQNKKKKREAGKVHKGILVTAKHLKRFFSSRARSRRKYCVLFLCTEVRTYWGLDSPHTNVLEEKNIRTHRAGWPFFLGTGSQTVICVRFPLGSRAGWLSNPRLLANGNRKFIMTWLLIEFASSFCCSHIRLSLLAVSGLAHNTQNVHKTIITIIIIPCLI